jgi:ubiquinone/menaquinone biosynthesis C-methylase UbiE
MKSDILQQNKNSWDIVAHHFNGMDALPSYGPFTQTEQELQLFDDVKDKKVLDIGCGSGHSLLYMAKRGANELWGIDLSQNQITAAKVTLSDFKPQLFCAPMEENIGLPSSYFDCLYSIYAIGWTTDLSVTFQLIYSYLKPGGFFIFSWDHPLYPYIMSKDGKIFLEGSYQNEGETTIQNFKGEDAPIVIPKRKMSTYLNELIKAGFTIESVIESNVSDKYEQVNDEISDRYYSLYKARKFPNTMIIKARKK